MGGRPAKSIKTQNGNIRTGVKEARTSTEKKLSGDSKTVTPSCEISEPQKAVFDKIREMFDKAGLLGELDGYVLTEAAVVIDRLQSIEQCINERPDLLFDRDICNTRKEYVQNFFRICNELSLSPQARAKMGILAAEKDEHDADPILRIFSGKETAAQ